MSNISIAKSGLKAAVIEAIYNEILTNSNNYYYFLGRTLAWGNDDAQESPQIDPQYESSVRSEMILLKKITSADVSYVIPRHDWVDSENNIFDMYDDQIGRTQSIQTVSWTGGNAYITVPDHGFLVGDVVKVSGVTPSGYNGKFVVTYIEQDRFAYDMASSPGTYSNGGIVTRCSTLGYESLEESKFYCMTSDFHVYKCLDNNKGAVSTVKPYFTTHTRVTLSDGYTWKYMYTVPIASRNKFMSLTDIPVTTAIKAPYYSRGSINSVTVNAYGINYSPASTELRVSGNGYLEENPLKVIAVNIADQGEGYITDPIAYSDDPFPSNQFLQESPVLQGAYLKAGKHIYLAASGGITGTEEPTHTGSEIIYNGTVALKYVGTTLTINVTRTGDKVTDAELRGMIGYINLTNPGYGYDEAPIVSITGDGINGTAACNVTQGRIYNITILDRGEDYTSAVVEFTPPMEYDSVWDSEVTVALNDILYYSGNFYEVTNVDEGTTTGTIPPVHTGGAVVNGDVELTYVGATATGSVEIYYGFGYASTPKIYISSAPIGGTTARLTASTVKTDAKLTPIVENGQLLSVIVLDGGIGYTNAFIQILGDGEGALLSANLSYGDLNTNQANIELLAVPGTVDAVKVTNPGSGYSSSNAVITIEGDGEGAAATAVTQNGELIGVTMTAHGSGYTYANVIISAPNDPEGNQAKARAIVSPYEGHGKNAVFELGAKDITLFSSISGETNQGFVVNNDYRQIGIVKNPQQFATNKRYGSVLGSACYSIDVSGSSGNNIELDSVVTDAAAGQGNRFRVVAVEPGSGSCSLLLQSIDNAPLVLNQNLYYDGDILTITNLLAPTVNKYSGTLMFIDNRNSFLPSLEQTVAIKTAIRF